MPPSVQLIWCGAATCPFADRRLLTVARYLTGIGRVTGGVEHVPVLARRAVLDVETEPIGARLHAAAEVQAA